ncbi:hypothetical protein KSP39_PZI008957 [Platanthera zijinensis]|uniref:Uncharacterized protein n=1 Tax=Platanthera zijinensis TaxID=2320716 RepID=A0AAP0BND2_9ASPA
MDCYTVQESDDFVVPNEYFGLDVILPSTNDWSHWGFESNGLTRKYHCNTSAKENLLANSNSDTRMSPVEGIKVPRVQKSGSSISFEDFLMTGRRMKTSDDLYRDLIDFEVQDGLQNMDDIFLDSSFLDQDLMHLDNLYKSSSDTAVPSAPQFFTRREDSDANFGASQLVELSTITESLGEADVEGEPVCMEATVLQELENVMLQLNSRTRICIRDALYRLAGRSKEERDVANVMGCTPRSDIYCGNSRKEAAESIEPKTNVIDRAIATLMFARPGNAAAFGS